MAYAKEAQMSRELAVAFNLIIRAMDAEYLRVKREQAEEEAKARGQGGKGSAR